ncbi:hypothetical protein AAE478_003322 [Parahypoxylon ruwenzoriense]
MAPKSLFTILAVGLLARQAVAAEPYINFDIYSGNDCGSDDSKAITEYSSSIGAWKSTSSTLNCANTRIDLGNWTGENSAEDKGKVSGQNRVYIDTSPIEKNCQLVFYKQVDGESKHCSRTFPKRREDKETTSESRDVTEIKRAPLLGRDITCRFNKVDGKLSTRYGRQVWFSQQITCLSTSELGCPITGEYSATKSISHVDTQSNSVGGSVTGGPVFFQVSATYNHEWSKSDETSTGDSFGTSYSLSIGGGDRAYLTFTPKLVCGRGTFAGDGCDAALKFGEREWCIPALYRGTNGKLQPDGDWDMVLTN